MKTSQQIAQKLDALQARRESVASEATEAGNQLADARKRAVSAGGATVQLVAQAQANHTALVALLGEIDEQLSSLEVDLKQAQTNERRAETAAKVRELNGQKAANAERYDAKLREIDEYLSSRLPELIAVRASDKAIHDQIKGHGAVPELPLLAERRWSNSGLKFARHLAEMIAEVTSDQERQVRKSRAALKVA